MYTAAPVLQSGNSIASGSQQSPGCHTDYNTPCPNTGHCWGRAAAAAPAQCPRGNLQLRRQSQPGSARRGADGVGFGTKGPLCSYRGTAHLQGRAAPRPSRRPSRRPRPRSRCGIVAGERSCSAALWSRSRRSAGGPRRTAVIPMEQRWERNVPRAARGVLCILQIPEPDPARLWV